MDDGSAVRAPQQLQQFCYLAPSPRSCGSSWKGLSYPVSVLRSSPVIHSAHRGFLESAMEVRTMDTCVYEIRNVCSKAASAGGSGKKRRKSGAMAMSIYNCATKDCVLFG